MIRRQLAARAVADRRDRVRERRRARRAPRVLLAHRGAHGELDLGRARARGSSADERAQVDLEPRLGGDGVHADPAADAAHRQRRARRVRQRAARRASRPRRRRRARGSARRTPPSCVRRSPWNATRKRRAPSARCTMRSSPAPSSAMHADGVASSRAKRCFAPRRSPAPSSPTVAAKIIGRRVRTRAPSIVSARASIAARPRELSRCPGPVELRAVARDADRRALGEDRVEMRADEHRAPRAWRRAAPPITLPTSSVRTSCQPERPEARRHHRAARVLVAGGRGDLGERDLRAEHALVVGGEPRARGREPCEERRPSCGRSRRGRQARRGWRVIALIYGWRGRGGASSCLAMIGARPPTSSTRISMTDPIGPGSGAT